VLEEALDYLEKLWSDDWILFKSFGKGLEFLERL
jgi:hypothetical protein